MANQTWHRGIGSDITSDMSIEQQLAIAGLNWRVETSDIRYGADFEYESEGYRKAVYRSDTGLLLDVASDRWQPFQNREIVQTFHDFCTESGLTIDHLGYLQEGRTIFAGADLKSEIDVRKVGDIVRGRLLLFNYHVVGNGLSVKLHLERLVCTNGMTQPVRINNRVISHVGAFNRQKIQELLEASHRNFQTFGEHAELLAETPMTVQEAQILLVKEFGDPQKPIWDQPAFVQTCMRLFLGQAKGSEMLSAFQTAWGLLNAVTEATNYHSKLRGGVAGHINSLWNGTKGSKQNNFMQTLVRVSSR